VKTAIYQALERVRDVGAAGSNPVIPTNYKNRIRAKKTSSYAVFFRGLD